MLDFFLTKVKGLFSSPAPARKPVSKKETVKVTKEVVKETPLSDNEDKNRVVFSPTKPVAQPVTQSSVSKEEIDKANAQAQTILQNAKKVEADAKVKEAEIFQRLSSLDEKERYLIQKEKSLDQQSLD